MAKRRKQQEIEQQQPDRTFFFFNLRWGTYTGISFLTSLSIIYPVTAYASASIILGFGVFIGIEIFRDYSENLRGRLRHTQHIFYKAIANNAADLSLFILSIIAGIVIGLGV